MRHANVLLIILLLLVAVGCAPVDTTESGGPSRGETVPESGLESVAGQAFGASLLSVTSALANSPAPHWRADIVLDSDLPLRDIDTASAQVLVHLASEDSSSTPIVVSVVGPGLAPEGARAQWGQLFYDWGLYPGEPTGERGSTVTLSRSEADEPLEVDGIAPSSAYEVRARGVWRKVNLDTLGEWSRIGTPEPEPSSP